MRRISNAAASHILAGFHNTLIGVTEEPSTNDNAGRERLHPELAASLIANGFAAPGAIGLTRLLPPMLAALGNAGLERTRIHGAGAGGLRMMANCSAEITS